MVSTVSVAAITVRNLEQNIDTVELSSVDENTIPPSVGAYPGGYNFLIVGSDTRKDQGYEGDSSTALNDVTMLLHVSEDHTSAVAVSIPRDLVVPIPSCPDPEGGSYSAMSAQPINVTLTYGGLPCTVLTVEALTGLDIQFAGLITFQGVIEMSNAVGGVNVCVDAPINDPYTGLVIEEAGTANLQGAQALAFLRSRYSVGDRSDLGRISSQQVYLSSLVRTLKSEETLSNVPRLYSIASAATQNMTLSSNLKSLDTLVAVAQSLQNIPLERIVFVQYPGTTGVGGIYEGKVAPIVAQAEELFGFIEADEPFALADTTNIGSVADPNAPVAAEETETPTDTTGAIGELSGVAGQTAADYTCSKAN
jgi:LCP family protein required for cell wall assembly